MSHEHAFVYALVLGLALTLLQVAPLMTDKQVLCVLVGDKCGDSDLSLNYSVLYEPRAQKDT